MGNVRAVIVIKIVIGSTNENECRLKQSRRSTLVGLGPCGTWGGGFEIRGVWGCWFFFQEWKTNSIEIFVLNMHKVIKTSTLLWRFEMSNWKPLTRLDRIYQWKFWSLQSSKTKIECRQNTSNFDSFTYILIVPSYGTLPIAEHKCDLLVYI